VRLDVRTYPLGLSKENFILFLSSNFLTLYSGRACWQSILWN